MRPRRDENFLKVHPEKVFFLSLTLKVKTADGVDSTFDTFCTGPSEAKALNLWTKEYPKLARSLKHYRVVTPRRTTVSQ